MDNEVVCRGSIALGSACRKCRRCKEELSKTAVVGSGHEIVKLHGYEASIGYKSYKGQWELGSAPGIHAWTPQDVLDYCDFWKLVSERLAVHNGRDTTRD